MNAIVEQDLPRTPKAWRELAIRLWANGDEARAIYAHGRAQEMESKNFRTERGNGNEVFAGR